MSIFMTTGFKDFYGVKFRKLCSGSVLKLPRKKENSPCISNELGKSRILSYPLGDSHMNRFNLSENKFNQYHVPKTLTLKTNTLIEKRSSRIYSNPLPIIGFTGPLQDATMMVIGILGAFLWVRIFDELARADVLEQKLSRKIVHISTGLIYMLLWPFFSDFEAARIYAAFVPFVNITKLVGLATGIIQDEAAVRAISRRGDPKELLQGPLYYVLAFSGLILCFWRESPPGIIGLSLMCGGDGFADVIGRRYGSQKLPWNNSKSWAGSGAMFLFGFIFAFLYTYWFSTWGYFEFSLWETGIKVAILTFACTVAESLPQNIIDDNLSVPLTAGVVGFLLFY